MPQNLSIGPEGFTNVPEGAQPLTPGRPLNYSPWKMQSPPQTADEPLQSNISPYDAENKQRVLNAAMKARQDQMLGRQLREKGELDAATGPLVGVSGNAPPFADGGRTLQERILNLDNVLDLTPTDEINATPFTDPISGNPTSTRRVGFLASPFERKAAGGVTETPKAPSPVKIGMGSANMPQESTFAMRGSAYGLRHSGFLNSSVPGRTDKIGLNVRNGSYVIPADVVSHYGQGNSLAGGNYMDKVFKQGPYGTGGGRPTMPRMPGLNLKVQSQQFSARAKGGPTHVPVMAAGGEYLISPEAVKRIGGGDSERGFRILDAFVLRSRKKHISTLKGLKPPRKD